MNEEFHIALIQKRLNKSITADEDHQLSKWIDLSDDNLELYNDICTAWKHLPAHIVPVDTAEEWEKLDRKINYKRKNNVVPLKRYLAVAASLLALVTFYFLLSPTDQISIEATHDNQVVLLPDNSQLLLSQGSILQYSKDFGEDRSVYLHGAARISVTHDPQSPFTVQGPKIKVTVLGTEFIYADYEGSDQKANVQLIQGAVSVMNKIDDATIILSAGEQVELSNNRLVKMSHLKLSNYEWLDPDLNFQGVMLSQVLSEIENYFGVKVEVMGISECLFTGDLRGLDFDTIMNTIAKLYDADIETSDAQYVLRGTSCE